MNITDNGIGMSQTIMTNELLDFGGSYWKSNRFKYDFQGIHSKGFESIGKFGIGFFSTFMLGEKITITSWKFGEAITNMKTLDFHDGLSSNPILRDPSEEEKSLVIDRGTSITIKIKEDPFSKTGFIGNSQFKDNTLFSLVKYFIPSPNVKITIEELDGNINTIKPNTIADLEFNDFIDHVHIIRKESIDFTGIIDLFKKLNLELFEIRDENRLYGKLAILPQVGNIGLSSTSIVLSNGIRINELGNFAGYIVTDDVISIKRDEFSKLVPYDVLKNWADQQKQFIESSPTKNLYTLRHLGLLLTFNYFDDSLPITLTKKDNNYNFFTIKQFKLYLKNNNEVKFHIEGHTLGGRLPNCDGFIKLSFGFDIKK
ncbi:ATP-binding protein [Maribacter halichondriae]|uniref:ATP-binding protein n=1 Tax=Maribacter halichondriae TaxID=2980554 RepID=UPI002358F6DD|nr:ATP-binding protein [Maribacter sp. Hal144]